MRINTVVSTYGRDFTAIMQCEHCGHKQTIRSGYDDNFYHQHVIPAMTCESCGKNRSGIVPETPNNNGTASVTPI